MNPENNKVGWWFLPAIVVGALSAFGPYLVPIALVQIPLYLEGYGNLTVQYKVLVVSLFLLVGILSDLLVVGRHKRSLLYQLAWTLYVSFFIGMIVLVRSLGNNADPHALAVIGSFYGAYLLFFLLVIRVFHIKFQYINSGRKSRASGKPVPPNPERWWKLLTLALVLFWGWLFLFGRNLCAAGFHTVQFFLPKDTFVVNFPDKQITSLVWPGFFGIGGVFALIPVILLCANFTEWTLRWILVELTNGDAQALAAEAKGANRALFGAVRWITLPMLPLMAFGLTHFYYLDPSGIHHVRWPFATENRRWEDVRLLTMSAWGEGESQYVYHMRYSVGEIYDDPLEISWDYLSGITDQDVARSYLQVSRALAGNQRLLVKTTVSPGGMEFLKGELGDRVKDLLLKNE